MIRLLMLFLLLAAQASAAVVFVQAGAVGSGDGSSWSNACPTLQAGLARAGTGDQVWIAQGTYTPGTNRSDTFTIPDGVEVYGGFVGNETALNQRHDDPGLVVLSGEIGTAGDADNIKRLVTMPGSGRIDTLTVTKANYDGTSASEASGLVAVTPNTVVKVIRCRFVSNRAFGPRIIWIKYATALLDRCEILDSSYSSSLSHYAAAVSFNQCRSATMSRSVIDGVDFYPNASFSYAVQFTSGSNELMTDCILINCHSGWASSGGAVRGCTYIGNTTIFPLNYYTQNCIFVPSINGTSPAVDAYTQNNWRAEVDGDPQFLDPAHPKGADGVWLTADDGLQLRPTSPCIDRGRYTIGSSLLSMSQIDILGMSRPQGRYPDLGAYEYPTGNTGPFANAQRVQAQEDVLLPIVLSGTDADGDVVVLRVSALPGKGSLFPTTDGVHASGSALTAGSLPYTVANGGIVLYRTAADEYATAYTTFAYTAYDGQVESDPVNVTIDVVSVNDAPEITQLADLQVAEDSGQRVVALSGINAGTPGLAVGHANRESQILSLTATSSDPSVVPNPTVSYISPNTTGSLAFAPVANASGTVTITITVHDDGGTANGGIDTTITSFVVTVLPVNDPPQMAAVANLTLPEDCTDGALTTVTLTGIAPGPPDEAGQTLSLSAVSSDTAVIGIAGIDYTPGATTALVHLTLVPNANGTALIFVSLFDTGGTANGGSDATARVFRVTVTPLEDFPQLTLNTGFTAIAGQTTTLGADHLRVTDGDLPPDSSLVYTLTVTPASGTLMLTGVDLAAGSTFTQADIAAGRVSYRNHGGTTATDTFSITWSDGISPPQGPATVTLTLIGIALPVIVIPGPADVWTEGLPAAAIAPAATVNDADPLPWDHGSITATEVSGGAAGDVLSLADQGNGAGEVGVAGTTLTYSGQVIGTWTAGNEVTPLTVTFNTSFATPAAAQAVVRRLRFANSGHNPGSTARVVRVVVNDGSAGPSVPAMTSVAVIPVDDPPVVSTTWIAVPAGVTSETELRVGDPDSTVFTWTLGGSPTLADVQLIDPSRGRLRIAPHPGASGRETLALTISDFAHQALPVAVELVITGLDDARPHPAGELPPDAYANGLVDTTVRFDCSDLGGSVATSLSFQATADAPGGVILDPVGNDQVRVRWLVPTGATGLFYQRFGIIAIDATHQAAGVMPLQILIRPLPGGGG